MKRDKLVIVVFLSFIPCSLAAVCTAPQTDFTPLIDFGASETYLGYSGRKFTGSNDPPPQHMASAMEMAGQIEPLDSSGQPDAVNGKIGYCSIGMSNTNQEFGKLINFANVDPSKDPKVVLINGAQGGVPAEDMLSINDPFWTTNIPNKLSGAGITAQQVQAVWFKQTNRGPTGSFPNWALNLKDQFVTLLQHVHTTFSNIKIVYITNRIYAGYASSTLNPEPYAYEQGFACKWVIDMQVDGDMVLNFNNSLGLVRSALLLWGPYIWADGINPNSEGLFWTCPDDFKTDGTHPSDPIGQEKVGQILLNHLQTDPTTFWYRTGGATNPPPPTSTSPSPPPTTSSSGDQCYGYGADGGACLADCDCGGCGGDGCMPGDCDGPTRPEDAGKCSGSWNYGGSCPCGPTSSPSPSTTAPPPPPPQTTSSPAPPTTSQGQTPCSTFNANPPGCRGSCWCGYCSPLGCTEGDSSGPDSGSCNGQWQFFGPC